MADQGMKILIVENIHTMRQIIKSTLKQLEYTNITEAEDGEVAFEKLKDGEFDFVITDWDMPKMTGLDLLKSIKGNEKLKEIPVLLITSEPKKENLEQAVQAGANDYIVKPFTADFLQEKINRITKEKKKIMARQNSADEEVERFAKLLYGVLFFNIFSLEELVEIVSEARLIKWKKFGKGQKIFTAGSFDQHFYIVIQGKVDIRKPNGGHKEVHVGTIHKGEVFGEMVVCAPGKPKKASAYVSNEGEAILCEIDSTLISTVPALQRVKFMKKFLDLIVDRLHHGEQQIKFYEHIIQYAVENNMSCQDEYFLYTLETAVNENNRLTQFIKYTDFLIARKIDPENGYRILKNLLELLVNELDKSFRLTEVS